jgi:transposase
LRREPDACGVVRVPSIENEDVKRPHRERKRLVTERVQPVNQAAAAQATTAKAGGLIISELDQG